MIILFMIVYGLAGFISLFMLNFASTYYKWDDVWVSLFGPLILFLWPLAIPVGLVIIIIHKILQSSRNLAIQYRPE